MSQSALSLQRGLDQLLCYCDQNMLTLNTDKTKIVVFRQGGRPSNHKWFYGTAEKEVTN